MMHLMHDAPFDFIMNHQEKDLAPLEKFVHRTFNGIDFITFINALKHIYKTHNGLEDLFSKRISNNSLQLAISEFKKVFFQTEHLPRTTKHISDPLQGSAAKRINMFLRWMVRKDNKGVDFGIWKSINPSVLSCPLDVHSGNIARQLGIMKRTQNDAKAVAELDAFLRQLDVKDPAKYDFALFGIGAFNDFDNVPCL